MERLTERNHIYYACEFMDSGLEKPFNKLAEYEDTELTPSEIHLLNKFKGSQIEKLLEENGQLKQDRDYWEREAKKYCAQIGEIRILAVQELYNK